MVAYLRSEAPQGAEWTGQARFVPPAEATGDVMFVGSDQAGFLLQAKGFFIWFSFQKEKEKVLFKAMLG